MTGGHGPEPGGPAESVRLLLLEDEAADAEAMLGVLRGAGLEAEGIRVATEEAFRAALAGRPEVVLADYLVPGFGALRALEVVAELDDPPPVIVVTGKVDDAVAAECLRLGAEDYLLKDRLARLPEAVRRALGKRASALSRATDDGRDGGPARTETLDFHQDLVGIFTTSPGGRILEANAALARILGFADVEAALEADALAVYPDPEARRAFVAELRSRGRLPLFERELRRADGTPVHVLESVMGIFDGEGELLSIRGYMLDVTPLKQAEAERDTMVTAMDQAAESVVITDTTPAIRYVNAAFTRLTGYARQEALGENPRLIKSGAHDQAFYESLWATILAGGTWTGRITNRRKDGSRFIADATISPIHGAEGVVTGYVSFQKDVTSEVEMERHLQQLHKLDAVGRLAAGVAHDFNNVLSVITTSAQLCQRPEADPAEVMGDLEEIVKATRRGAALSKQLLAFSRQEVVDAVVVDLNDVVRDSVKMLARVLGEDIALRVDLDPGVGMVRVDPSQFQTVVLNLAINARDAMPGGGRLTLRTLGLGACACPGSRGAEGCVRLEVSDTGHGMDADTLARVFEPFFTTKTEGKGSGLGLSMVYGAVTQAGGGVEVDSAPGAGTTVRIHLPAATGAARQEGDLPRTGAGRPGGVGEVLLVEDDAAVRREVRKILESLGHTVHACSNAEEALALAWGGADLDLLVTDVVMPGMDGPTLARHVREARPGLPVLFISGYAPKRAFPEGVPPAGAHFLFKPFTREQIGDKVREALQGP